MIHPVPEAEHCQCGGSMSPGREFLRRMESKGYFLIKEGQVPPWFQMLGVTGYRRNRKTLYVNTKEKAE